MKGNGLIPKSISLQAALVQSFFLSLAVGAPLPGKFACWLDFIHGLWSGMKCKQANFKQTEIPARQEESLKRKLRIDFI